MGVLSAFSETEASSPHELTTMRTAHQLTTNDLCVIEILLISYSHSQRLFIRFLGITAFALVVHPVAVAAAAVVASSAVLIGHQ